MLLQCSDLGTIYVLFMLLILALTVSWEGTKGSQRLPKKHTRTGGLAVNGSSYGVLFVMTGGFSASAPTELPAELGDQKQSKGVGEYLKQVKIIFIEVPYALTIAPCTF